MTTISLFTSINYTRSRSYTEAALSTLSHYFYLGGTRATVIRGNEVKLEVGRVSWHTIAFKVVSYVLLFPLTLTLFAVNVSLRHQHHFTIITPSRVNPSHIASQQKKEKESIQETNLVPPQKERTAIPPTNTKTAKETEASPNPSLNLELIEKPVVEPPKAVAEPTPSSAATVTAQTIENIRQQVLTPPAKKEPFHPFFIKISKDNFSISSKEEMLLKAGEITRQVLDKHIKLSIEIPFLGFERKQAMKFIEELRTTVNVIASRWEDTFYVVPKRTEEIQKDFTIRRYTNGVIEEVQSTREEDDKDWWDYWQGRRIYPNGLIQEGRFDNFDWHSGTSVENGLTTYRLPNTLLTSYSLKCGLMYANIEGEKQLIVIKNKYPDHALSFDYVQAKEELIPTLAEMLKQGDDVREKNLQAILSGPINCEAFVDFLFKTNSIFSLQPTYLQILLKIIQEKKLIVNFHQQHPETKETLLDRYSKSATVLDTLLTIDPTLIQRTEGAELVFVRALLSGNKKGASILFKAMEKQKFPLFPRELIFKKVAFSEGEITLEELQAVPFKDQEIIYQLANIHSQLNVVRTMRALGFGRREDLIMREGPSIFGCNMDLLEIYEHLKGFLTRLRSQGLLLTQSEFNRLPSKNYIEKGRDIGRILGRNYIEKKAHELGLKHVKVPKKMIVIDDNNTQLDLKTSIHLDIETSSDGLAVYAEKILRSDRSITSEEISELLRLFEATGFSDIHWGNIVVAKDGIYIIDTEFTNFWLGFYLESGRQYAEMAKIVHELPMEQQSTLIDELNTKIKTYQEKEEELNQQRTLRLKVEQQALQKTRSFHRPYFTFPIKELIV